MLIQVGYEIVFNFPTSVPLVLLLRLHPSIETRIRKGEDFTVTPSLPIHEFIDQFGNRCGRTFAPAGRIGFTSDAIVEDDGQPDPQYPNAIQHAVQDLPDEVLPFLLASRYCEVDSELNAFAWEHFGAISRGWSKVQAVCDFVHRRLQFDYMQARVNRTALEAFRERVGVCRDFTHLAVTLCRCLNIPARYVTGYLGDIGIPALPFPMDFNAWFEVYLSGRWHVFDARHNEPRIGRVMVARGRDAADVPLTTTFGVNHLASFKVWTEEVRSTETELASAG